MQGEGTLRWCEGGRVDDSSSTRGHTHAASLHTMEWARLRRTHDASGAASRMVDSTVRASSSWLRSDSTMARPLAAYTFEGRIWTTHEQQGCRAAHGQTCARGVVRGQGAPNTLRTWGHGADQAQAYHPPWHCKPLQTQPPRGARPTTRRMDGEWRSGTRV
jgi:hypothetical protein